MLQFVNTFDMIMMKGENSMTVGDRLSEIINNSGMSQKEFADVLGVSTSTVSRVINGQQELNRASKLIICDHFGLNLLWLETGEGKKQKDRPDEHLMGTLESVLTDNPAILKLMSAIVARMTVSDWKKLNDFIISIGGAE